MSAEEININSIFIALCLVAILVGAGVVLLFVAFNSKKNKLMLTKLTDELAYQKRLHATELKALRGQMNPHFVHNSINAIQYYIQRNEVDISEYYLAKFSKLLRLFFEYSRRQYVTIAEERELLENYLEIEKLRFEDKLSFKISIDPKLDSEAMRLPAMMLQPVVENAVNHGLFHKQGKGLVTVQFKYLDELSYQVIILDNGIGIKKAKALKEKRSSKVVSHSSNVLEERLELLNLSKDWEVSCTFEDLSETHNETGTRVTLTFKEIIERH